MTYLKPCPFCGKEPTAFKDNYDRIAIMCENCDLYFGIELECGEELVDGWRARIKSVEEAVEMWNKRTQFDDGVRMRANRTASDYNNFILKNNYVWKNDVPSDIFDSLPYIE